MVSLIFPAYVFKELSFILSADDWMNLQVISLNAGWAQLCNSGTVVGSYILADFIVLGEFFCWGSMFWHDSSGLTFDTACLSNRVFLLAVWCSMAQ